MTFLDFVLKHQRYYISPVSPVVYEARVIVGIVHGVRVAKLVGAAPLAFQVGAAHHLRAEAHSLQAAHQPQVVAEIFSPRLQIKRRRR